MVRKIASHEGAKPSATVIGIIGILGIPTIYSNIMNRRDGPGD